MRSYVTLAQGLVRVISPHPIHACARGCLSVLFIPSLYFFLKSFFHLFLIPAMVPDENSMEDPLCNSSFGSMVSLDYVTPDTKTPYERRFGQPFKGPIIPFGSLVEYHPITAEDQSRIHQFGKKVLPGLFLGYALYAGEFGRVTY